MVIGSDWRCAELDAVVDATADVPGSSTLLVAAVTGVGTAGVIRDGQRLSSSVCRGQREVGVQAMTGSVQYNPGPPPHLRKRYF